MSQIKNVTLMTSTTLVVDNSRALKGTRSLKNLLLYSWLFEVRTEILRMLEF